MTLNFGGMLLLVEIHRIKCVNLINKLARDCAYEGRNTCPSSDFKQKEVWYLHYSSVDAG